MEVVFGNHWVLQGEAEKGGWRHVTTEPRLGVITRAYHVLISATVVYSSHMDHRNAVTINTRVCRQRNPPL